MYLSKMFLSAALDMGLLVVVALFLAISASPVMAAEPAAYTIDADFPGGNVIVDRLAPDAADLHPDIRDTQTFWFYWNFRVSDAQGKTVTFRFNVPTAFASRGPAISLDQGQIS